MIIRCDRQQSFIDRAVLLSTVAVFVLTAMSAVPREARAATSAPAPAKVSEVMVYSAAEESSPLVESVRDGGISPIAETTGPGGMKWFMVKTRAGNIGWIKASDNAETRKVDDHFRAMPRDTVMLVPASSAPEAATTASATGAITIPVKILRNLVVVPVTFYNGNSSVTGNLVMDTGASQTTISKRIARELRLLSIASGRSYGIGGTVSTDVGLVEAIKVGTAGLKSMRVSIHDFSPDPSYEGLLGFDFLGRYQIAVDSEKHLLVQTPSKK